MAARSPITDVATLNKSAFDEFNAFMTERTNATDATIAAYKNRSTVPGPLQAPARLLADSTYIPAAPQAIIPDRKGKAPQFVVLSRVAAAGAPAANGNVLTEIRSATDPTRANHPVPHVLIGFAGEVVQFADFDATTNYLGGKSYESPAQLSKESLADSLIDSVIQLTVANEAGSAGYACYVPNDANAGAAFGFIQFNQKAGTLPKLMAKMAEYAPEKFNSIFGDAAGNMKNQAWVRATDLRPYASAIISTAQVPEFQKAQRDLAREVYWADAVTTVNRLGVNSQRAYAVAFDGCVQRGGGFMYGPALAAAKQQTSATDKLRVLAEWADAKDGKGGQLLDPVTHRPVDYGRRRALTQASYLSDTPLHEAKPVGQATVPVYDQTIISIKLEGRAGDAVTQAQRDAVSRVIRAACDTFGILPDTSRIFGLDRVSSDTANPGTFSYIDLLSTVVSIAGNSATAWFRPAAPVTAAAVDKAVSGLTQQLAKSRSNIQALAVLQCYDEVKAAGRAQAFAGYSRAAYQAGAVAEATTKKNLAASAGASPQQVAEAAKPPPSMAPEMLRGLLFDFKTGKWSDDKAVGRIS